MPEPILAEWIGTLRVRYVSGGSDVDVAHLDYDRIREIAQAAIDEGERPHRYDEDAGTVALHLFVEVRDA